MLLVRLFDEFAGGLEIADVEFVGGGVASVLRDFFGDLFSECDLTIGEYDGGAASGKRLGKRLANP